MRHLDPRCRITAPLAHLARLSAAGRLVMLQRPVYGGRIVTSDLEATMERSLTRFHAKYVSAAEAGDYYQVFVRDRRSRR